MNTVVFSHKSAVMQEASQREAYEALVAEFELFPAEQLLPVNVDIPDAITAALGALPRINAQREALATLPGFDIARFDRLELYARALTYAHDLYQVASQPADDLKSLQEEAAQLRELLFRDASVAVAREFMPKDALDDLKGANGYTNTANDLRLLVVALRQNWAKIQGKCATTDEELTYAEKLAFHLLRIYGLRENGPEGRARATDMRMRAFNVFFKLYDEVRQSIAWLRRGQGDADKIAPSLYVFRSHARKKEGTAVAPDGASPTVEGDTESPKAASTNANGATSPIAPGAVNPVARTGGPFAG